MLKSEHMTALPKITRRSVSRRLLTLVVPLVFLGSLTVILINNHRADAASAYAVPQGETGSAPTNYSVLATASAGGVQFGVLNYINSDGESCYDVSVMKTANMMGHGSGGGCGGGLETGALVGGDVGGMSVMFRTPPTPSPTLPSCPAQAVCNPRMSIQTGCSGTMCSPPHAPPPEIPFTYVVGLASLPVTSITIQWADGTNTTVGTVGGTFLAVAVGDVRPLGISGLDAYGDVLATENLDTTYVQPGDPECTLLARLLAACHG